jgi:hypothetical protein
MQPQYTITLMRKLAGNFFIVQEGRDKVKSLVEYKLTQNISQPQTTGHVKKLVQSACIKKRKYPLNMQFINVKGVSLICDMSAAS